MLYAGARNQTAAQMATALHFTLPPERLHPAFNALDLALAAPAGDDAEAFRLKIANSTWVQTASRPPELPRPLAENYGAGLFVRTSRPRPSPPARRSTPGWRTDRGSDQGPVPAGLDQSVTVLVLANAVFFHGDWVTPFEAKKPERNVSTPRAAT